MVTTWCCVTPEREIKTAKIMSALAQGWGEPAQVVVGAPPDNNEPFVIWGHLWMALKIIPDAIKRKRPFWFIDNGYWQPAQGRDKGYYRLTYRGIAPVELRSPDVRRAAATGVVMKPWRKTGKHVVIALPGIKSGKPFGLDLAEWCKTIEFRVRTHTARPVVIRAKDSEKPLAEDLRDAWALVTHSSNAAVEAAIAGIPVFVEHTSAAAPVGSLDLGGLEYPRTPDDRDKWFASLVSQQFSLAEMRDGTAYKFLRQVREQVDG